MIKEIEREIWEMGTRYNSDTVQDKVVTGDSKFQTIELFGYSYMLKDGYLKSDLEKIILYFGDENDLAWCKAEIQERLNFALINKNPGEAWKIKDKFWGQFLRDGIFSYSYTERWQQQLPFIINELKIRPNSRQAMMTMYSAEKDIMNFGGRDRVPCSVSYQFAIRNDKLTLIYNQRSCDFLKFFAADVYFTVHLLNYVANEVGVEMGNFIHFLGSLHAFAGDLEGRGIF
jgi:thymidylate synthase